MKKTFSSLSLFLGASLALLLGACQQSPVTMTKTTTTETKTAVTKGPSATGTVASEGFGKDLGAPPTGGTTETKATERKVSSQVRSVSGSVDCSDSHYTVKKGDTLWGIADREYKGRAYLYPLLSEANRMSDPDKLRPGQVLTIPCCIPTTILVKRVLTTRKTRLVTQQNESQIKRVETTVASNPQPVVQKQEPAPAPKPAPVSAPPPPVAPQSQSQSQSQTVVVNLPAPSAGPASVPESPRGPPPPTPTPVPVPPKPTGVPTPAPEIPKPPTSSLITPGSLWNTAMMTPLEPGNKADYFHVDQGVVIGKIGKVQIEPYVAVNAVKDTKGYQWNNRAVGEGGLKLVRPFSHGLIAVGGAYAVEWRASETTAKGKMPSMTKTAPIGYLEYWFGWGQPNSRISDRKFLTALPGSTWMKVGNVSPFERNNVIGLTRLEQGVTALKLKHVALIPIGTFQLGMDSDKKPWNNRYTYGGGLKVSFPTTKASFDIQGGYECASQYRGVPTGVAGFAPGSSACGPTVRVNLWTGWRHLGGE